MKKLALDIGELRVESFGTAEPSTVRGTVAAAEATAQCSANCTCTCGGANPVVVIDAAPTCYCCV
jgi:hypothetical protein